MTPTVRTLVFTVLVPGSVTIGIPTLLLVSGVEELSYNIGPLRFAGLLPIALGAAIYAWCASDFALRGRGTPAPIDPPKTLQSRGLYRLMRNPMYVGVLLVIVGEALLFESGTLWVYGLLIGLVFHSFIVLYEEPNLRERFGTSYEEYCRQVPRWVPALVRGRTRNLEPRPNR